MKITILAVQAVCLLVGVGCLVKGYPLLALAFSWLVMCLVVPQFLIPGD